MPDNLKNSPSSLNWDIYRKIYIGTIDNDSNGKSMRFGMYGKKLEKAKDICLGIKDQLVRSTFGDADDQAPEHTNTVVGILGERGSGKTSFLYTLKKALSLDESDDIYALDVIDPTNFDTSLSALEAFLASLNSERRRLNGQYDRSVSVQDFPRLTNKFKEISETLASLRMDESDFRKENPSMEILDNMSRISNMRNSINDLCHEFLDFTNRVNQTHKKCIAVFFDDIDLAANNEVYKLTQDIRKFLSGNVLVVISYRDRQLVESLENKNLDDNMTLIKHCRIRPEDIYKRVQDVLQKLVPSENRITLVNQTNLLNKPIVEALSALAEDDETLKDELFDRYTKNCLKGSNSNISVKDWLSHVIYYKTKIRIIPFNKNEETLLMWPRNIRELIPLVHMVHEELEDTEYNNDNIDYQRLESNLEKFGSYFRTLLGRNLDEKLYSDFIEWDLVDYEAKNYSAYSSMLSRIDEILSNKNKAFSLLDIQITRPDNVTLGDISYIANLLISCSLDNEVLRFYGYSFKLIYSLELLDTVIKAVMQIKNNKSKKSFTETYSDHYLALINSCPVTPEIDSTGYSLAILKPSKKQVDDFKVYSLDDHGIQLTEFDISIEMVFNQLNNIDKVLDAFCCTNVPTNSGIIKRSRSFDKKPDSSEESNANNRKLFTLNDYLDNEEEPSLRVNEFGQGEFWISPLYALGKRSFIKEALKNLSDNKDVYVLYSMFDVDIFNGMNADMHVSKEQIFKRQLMRLNTAIFISSSKYPPLEAIKDAKNDATLGEVRRVDELTSFSTICSPFVKTKNYRLFFSEKEKASNTSAEGFLKDIDIDALSSIFDFTNLISEAEKKAIETMTAFIESADSGKEIKEFASLVKKNIDDSKKEQINKINISNSLKQIIDLKSVRIPNRIRLRDIVISNPAICWSAYMEYLDAQRG